MNISGVNSYLASPAANSQKQPVKAQAEQARFAGEDQEASPEPVPEKRPGAEPLSEQRIAQTLAAIKQKPAVERTREDTLFIEEHDQRFADITAKPESQRTADDLDYLQKATGFVNTMAVLSKEEKALFDELQAAGNAQAAEALSMIALTRQAFAGEVGLPDGRSYNPRQTEITADNVEQLFRRMYGTPDAEREQAFDALVAALTTREAART